MLTLTLQQISSIATGYNQGRLDYTPSEVSLYANIALGVLAAQDQYRSLESTYNFSITSGTTQVALPTDFFSDVALSLSSGTNYAFVRRLLPTDAVTIDSYGTTRDVPRIYTVYGSQLLLAPASDSTYSGLMRYSTKVPNLMQSTDTPGVEDRYHYAVALKTAELLSAARNDSDQEALNHQRYVDYMTSIPNDRALRQRDKMIGASRPTWWVRTT